MSTPFPRTTFGPGPLSRIFFVLAGGLAFAFMQQAGRSGDFLQNWPMYLFALFLFFLIAGIAQLFSRAAQNRQQRRRDQRASEILGALKSGQTDVTFSLYLRGFATTGTMPQVLKMSSMSKSGAEGFLDLEAVLAQTLEHIAPLVALGRPGELIGAGRVHCEDDQWQDNLVLLARSAQSIFILPTDSPGTMWEIDFIVRMKLLRKCYFLMPPWNSKTAKEMWHRAAARAQQGGLRLRAYKHNGMIFTLREDGAPERTRTFGDGLAAPNAKQIRTCIAEMLGGRSDEPKKPTLGGKPNFLDKEDELDELDEPVELVLLCPKCGAPYLLSDYRQDAAVIFCTVCDTELPKRATKESQPHAAAVR